MYNNTVRAPLSCSTFLRTPAHTCVQDVSAITHFTMDGCVCSFSDILHHTEWDDMQGQAWLKVPLSDASQEYERVIKIFKNRGMPSLTVVSV